MKGDHKKTKAILLRMASSVAVYRKTRLENGTNKKGVNSFEPTPLISSGAEGDRTPDLLNAIPNRKNRNHYKSTGYEVSVADLCPFSPIFTATFHKSFTKMEYKCKHLPLSNSLASPGKREDEIFYVFGLNGKVMIEGHGLAL
ncbi:MAG: hypothetical protein HZA02_03445 [Nitrospinae bacterium]|nr:hypothetical protein [Nitrospinota bacterium]